MIFGRKECIHVSSVVFVFAFLMRKSAKLSKDINLNVFRYGGIHVQKKEPNISTLVAESSFSGMTRRREREAKKEEEDTNPNWELTKGERNKRRE